MTPMPDVKAHPTPSSPQLRGMKTLLNNPSHLPATTLILSLFALLSRAANMPKQTGENPFTYPLRDDLVDGSQPVNLTWKATTKSTITINLLKGDPKNLDDLGAIIGLLDNEGWYEWRVSKYLEDSRSMPKGHMYGLKIINDEDEGFEYSSPFKLQVPESRFKRGPALKGKANSTRPAPPQRRSNSKRRVKWKR